MAVILNLAMLDSAIIVIPLKLTHTCQDWFLIIAQKKNFTHSFSLNLMMAAILNSAMLDSDTAILDSDTLLSSLRFTQKHSHSTLTLTQTNSIQLTRWWQTSCIVPSWFLPSWIQPFCTKLVQSEFKLNDSHVTWWRQSSWILSSCIQPFCTKKTSLVHSDSTWCWQPSWILPCWIQTLPSWIQTPCYLLSDSLKNILPPLWPWPKLIHSHLTLWWQPSWILPFWILPSWIQPFCSKLWLWLIQPDPNSFILTQRDDGSHIEF